LFNSRHKLSNFLRSILFSKYNYPQVRISKISLFQVWRVSSIRVVTNNFTKFPNNNKQDTKVNKTELYNKFIKINIQIIHRILTLLNLQLNNNNNKLICNNRINFSYSQNNNNCLNNHYNHKISLMLNLNSFYILNIIALLKILNFTILNNNNNSCWNQGSKIKMILK